MKNVRKVYAQYGVEYRDGKIKTPWGSWIPELLKQGNAKLGKSVWTWSMTPGTKGSCCCDCPGCYAKNGFYCMRSVQRCLARNQWIVEHDISFWRWAVAAQIHARQIDTVRIHAAGDFAVKANRDKYMSAWRWLAGYSWFSARTSFWTYTKVHEAESLFDGLPTKNAHVVPSLLPGGGMNYGTCSHVLDARERLQAAGKSVHICRCGVDAGQHCEGCLHCMQDDFVLFLEHGTSYRPASDEAWPRFQAAVAGQ